MARNMPTLSSPGEEQNKGPNTVLEKGQMTSYGVSCFKPGLLTLPPAVGLLPAGTFTFLIFRERERELLSRKSGKKKARSGIGLHIVQLFLL